MRNEITENKEFYILSRSIDNATKCRVVNVSEEDIEVKLDVKGKYEIDESVELFAMTQNGQLYFETIVKDVKDDIVSMWFPINYKYLQRREYSRINLNKEVILKKGRKKIVAKIVDLSAGGFKVVTSEQLDLLTEYSFSIDIDNETASCTFEPIRIELNGNNFVSSGRFNNISSHDRIALVQYCFRKQIENSNK
jgi:c-di-GMP-binding flagellar brake protein YcgR